MTHFFFKTEKSRLISTNKIYSQRNHFNLHFTYSLYAAAVISLQFTKEKKNSNVSIFVLWSSSSLYFGDSVRYINVDFKFRCFSASCARFDFSNPRQTFVRFNYLISITEGLSFQIHFPNASKTFWHSLTILPLIENTRGVNVPWILSL